MFCLNLIFYFFEDQSFYFTSPPVAVPVSQSVIVAVGVISVPLKVNVMVYALPALNELSSVPGNWNNC